MDDHAPWSNEISAREWIDRGGQQVVLGVDGGGTNTSCVVMECSLPENGVTPSGCGSVLGEGTAGSSNYHSVGGEFYQRFGCFRVCLIIASFAYESVDCFRVCLVIASFAYESLWELMGVLDSSLHAAGCLIMRNFRLLRDFWGTYIITREEMLLLLALQCVPEMCVQA